MSKNPENTAKNIEKKSKCFKRQKPRPKCGEKNRNIEKPGKNN